MILGNVRSGTLVRSPISIGLLQVAWSHLQELGEKGVRELCSGRGYKPLTRARQSPSVSKTPIPRNQKLRKPVRKGRQSQKNMCLI